MSNGQSCHFSVLIFDIDMNMKIYGVIVRATALQPREKQIIYKSRGRLHKVCNKGEKPLLETFIQPTLFIPNPMH